MWKSLVCACLTAASACAQLTPNSVTVNASRALTIQPDQILFNVFIDAPAAATLSDVLAALAPLGVTSANFSNVGTAQSFIPVTIIPSGSTTLPPNPPVPVQLEWAFGLPVPFAKVSDTVNALAALQTSLANAPGGLRLIFNVSGTFTSLAAQQQAGSCNMSDLLADARVQAQSMASAAGAMLGPVLAMSGQTNTSTASNLLNGLTISRYSSSGGPYTSPCNLTVQFGLVRTQ